MPPTFTLNGRVVKMKLIIKIVTLVTVTCIVSGQEDFCTTPTGVKGRCVLIRDCEKLNLLIKKSAQAREYLKQFHCGFQGYESKVCCSSKQVSTTTTTSTTTVSTILPTKKGCLTLQGTFGKCVKLEACPYIIKKLKNPTKENLVYVQKSRCIGPTQYSVCCDISIDIKYSSDVCPPSPDLPEPNGDCCGLETASENKIYKGIGTSIDQYPWLAIIEYTNNIRANHLCGGSLISSQYVLTAAHCITITRDKSRAKAVRLGEYNTINDGPDCIEADGDGKDCTWGAISIAINATTVHPDYNTDNIVKEANDIGLIKLSEMVTYNEFIRAICLPTLDISKSPPLNMQLIGAGWGYTDENQRTSDIKRHANLPYVDLTRCQKMYTNNGIPLVWNKQICAGGESNPCQGDSGGPLMYLNNKNYELVGISSYGPVACGVEGRPSIYTKVYDYLPWIKSIVKS